MGLDTHDHFVLSCVCAPLDVGIFCVFCTLFRLPNVGQGYNDIISLQFVIFCDPILPSGLCLSGENLHGPPPSIILFSELW